MIPRRRNASPPAFQRRHVPQQLACHRRDEHTQSTSTCAAAAVGVDLGIGGETWPPRTRAQSFERYPVFSCDVDEEHSPDPWAARLQPAGRHDPLDMHARTMAPVTR